MTKLLSDRYKIIRQLGSGGFGETFLAEDTQMPSSRCCVIKQLKPITHNPQVYSLVKERFQREAAILEELGTANSQIPALYAYFSQEDRFYLVQEWIAGQTLSQKVEQLTTIPESEVRHILTYILPVLAFIHSRGIVHRDIKPDNIIIRDADKIPVLIDFGAVRETMGTVVNSQGHATSSIVIGTPGFMPSEQAAGRPVYSSDLYSLGLTAIYLLTGKTPQELETDADTGEIIWRKYALGISPSLAGVLDKAVMYHPRDRFSSAQQMLQSLQSQSTPIAPTVPYTPPSNSSIPPTTPQTIPVSNATTTTATTTPNNGKMILLGSLLAGGLVSASIIIGLSLNKSPQPVVSQPNSVETVETTETVNTPASPPSNATIETPQPSPPPFPDSSYTWLSERYVTEADLVGKSAQELSIMRNSIYARKGRIFNSPELQSYFDTQPWYNPRYSPENFPNSLLSPLEIENAAVILDYQNRNGLRWVY